MWTALNRPAGQGGAPAAKARTNDLDAGGEWRRISSARLVDAGGVGFMWLSRHLSTLSVLVRAGRFGCRHLFASGRGHGVVEATRGAQSDGDPAESGVMPIVRPRALARPTLTPPRRWARQRISPSRRP